MSRATASRQAVAAQARKAAAAMASCVDHLDHADVADTRTVAEWFCSAAREGAPTAQQNWDGAAQLYLGLAGLLRRRETWTVPRLIRKPKKISMPCSPPFLQGLSGTPANPMRAVSDMAQSIRRCVISFERCHDHRDAPPVN